MASGGIKMKNKIFAIFLIFISVVMLATVTSAVQITKIGTGHDPAINGNNVTWSDTSGSIHVYDLTSLKDTKISSSNASHPAIYGNKLVWHYESSGTSRLTVYDIPSGARSYITQDVDQFSNPAIYGNRIVWSTNDSVYMRDISTSTQTKIGLGSDPDIYDTKVVYTSYVEVPEGADKAIRMYDINMAKKITVNSNGDPNTPHIWGTKVIWSDFYNHEGYIAMYDTSTNKTIDVTQPLGTDPYGNEYGASTGIHIAIENDRIVYHKSADDYEGKPGVYVYDIATGKSTLLLEYPHNIYTTPEVYGSKVVWGDSSSNIYVCDL
jgi:beta propeller repeat protein